MKKYIFALFMLTLVSCSNEASTLQDDDRIEDLTSGKWIVSDFDGKENKFSRGIVFSKDRQFFHLDSQGRVVPRHREIIFELSNDTLQIVDFNYEAKYIQQRGTQVFIVKDLEEDELSLKGVFPDSTSLYTFKKEEL